MTKNCILMAVALFSLPVWLQAQAFRFVEREDKQLALHEGNSPVLTYRYDVVEHNNVPEKDLRRMAGCYVHPLYGIQGEVLTDNAPRDHYHHHGVFWTWPHVGVHQADGTVRNHDLWTSNTELKQHFVRWIDQKTDGKQAVIEVENGWFVGKPTEGDKIMSEKVKMIVHRISPHQDGLRGRAVDFEFVWTPTDKAVTLRGSEGKSYGGFSVRFRPFIPAETLKKNPRAEAKRSEANAITISNGALGTVAENDRTETRMAWADYTSMFDGREQRSGATIFASKSHPDFMPTWMTRYYGALCVGWPGVDGRKFEPGEEIQLRYRIWIHDGAVTPEQIQAAYEEYIGS